MIKTANEWHPTWPTVALTDNEYYEQTLELNHEVIHMSDLSDTYVVAATNNENERVYYAIDHHSGGYPYWSTSFGHRKEFTKLDAAIRAATFKYDDYMIRSIHDVRVGVTKTTFVELDSNTVAEEQKKAALEKLTEDERRLLGL